MIRYITAVDIDFGGYVGHARYRLVGEGKGSITLSDGEIVPVDQIRFDDYLGACCERNGVLGVVVRLLPHEAKLHQYVDSVTTNFCSPEFSYPGEDLGVICEGSLIGRGTIEWRGISLALNTTNECFEASGVQGSVIIRTESENNAFPRMCNLYGLLTQLCRETGLNLMSYEQLRLYSPGRGYETIIRFSQSIEAKRFFTKMYFELCR